jgi:hypothetical protein
MHTKNSLSEIPSTRRKELQDAPDSMTQTQRVVSPLRDGTAASPNFDLRASDREAGGFKLQFLLQNMDAIDEDELIHHTVDWSKSNVIIDELNKTALDGKLQTEVFLWGKNHFGQLGLPRREKPEASVSVGDLEESPEASAEKLTKDLLASRLDP